MWQYHTILISIKFNANSSGNGQGGKLYPVMTFSVCSSKERNYIQGSGRWESQSFFSRVEEGYFPCVQEVEQHRRTLRKKIVFRMATATVCVFCLQTGRDVLKYGSIYHVDAGRSIALAVSRWLPTAAARVLVMWDLWRTKWRWGKFSSSTLVSPANLYSTNCSTITLIYHLSGRSTKWTCPTTLRKKIMSMLGSDENDYEYY
jgi:hypothetical protein